jgi:hypothetical protein
LKDERKWLVFVCVAPKGVKILPRLAGGMFEAFAEMRRDTGRNYEFSEKTK